MLATKPPIKLLIAGPSETRKLLIKLMSKWISLSMKKRPERKSRKSLRIHLKI
jgi:hypothetical protein